MPLAASIRVYEYNTGLTQDWQAYTKNHAEATLFHELPWKRAVERTFGHRSWYLLAGQDDRIVGVLPLFQINSVVAGRFLVSQPYATYGGVLADRPEVAAALLDEAKALVERIGARSLELRSIRAADPGVPVQSRHVSFQRALPDDPDAVLPAMPRKARAAARRAEERYGLDVSFDPGNLRTVWSLYARSMRRLGSPNYPYRFFRELLAALGDRCVVQLVHMAGRPAAGLLTFLHRDTVIPYFAGTDERKSIYGLNQYLYLRAMKWGVRNGYRKFDFGRSRIDNHGACDFKRHCGFEPLPLQYQTYVSPGREAPELSPDAPQWSLARSVWKRLPLPVTRPLGGWISRSIPG
ncbi:MAG: FemAB family PEP-CTERM system-associated protein [Planctomycetota bacterium]|nr:FemAB family PEP-CTERM system-associated protein [Planctomycetota bacterium]